MDFTTEADAVMQLTVLVIGRDKTLDLKGTGWSTGD